MSLPTFEQIREEAVLPTRRVETTHLHDHERCEHFDGFRRCLKDACYAVNGYPLCEGHGRERAIELLFEVHELREVSV